eukprot:scaffold3118_cov60-Attheya_sp.AAC.3
MDLQETGIWQRPEFQRFLGKSTQGNDEKEIEAADVAKPCLDDILTMGDNKKENAYDAFCDYILPDVVGQKGNDAKFNQMRVSEVTTPASDETFALLSLENAWGRWGFQASPRFTYSLVPVLVVVVAADDEFAMRWFLYGKKICPCQMSLWFCSVES